MSKKKAGHRRRREASPQRGKIKLTVIAVALCVVAAGAVAARWRSPCPAPVSSAASTAVTSVAAQSPGFAPGRPSKEYVYAGSRLVATEEPTSKSDQTISFDAVPDKTYGDAPLALSATATSNLPVSFSVTSGPATVSGNMLTIGGAGAVTLRADQAGSYSFNPAPSVTRSFNVAKASQTVSFDAAQFTGKTYGDAPFVVTASSSAGLPVSFTAAGSVSVSGNTVTINGAGAASVKASAAGDANHNAAPDVEHSFTVAKAAAAVTLGALTHTYDGASKSASAVTSPPGLQVTFAYAQNGVAVVAPTNAGSYSVVATVNDNNYQGAATSTLVINKAAAAVTLSNLSHTYDGAGKGATTTTSPPGLSVALSYTRDGAPVASPTHAGSYAVMAAVNDANYAGSASGTLVINKAQATLSLGSLSQTYDGSPRPASVTTSPAGLSGVTLTYNGSANAPTNAGSYAVVATLSNANYTASNATGTLVVSKATPTVTWANPADITHGTPLSSSQLNATSVVAGSFAYSPATGTRLNAGNGQTLSATFTPSDTNNYNSKGTTVVINVLKATPSITWANPADITHGRPLGPAQLNAASSFNGAGLAGSFAYTPGAGTVLNPGSGQTLSVSFTPSDASNFNAASGGAVINVLAAAPRSLSTNGTTDYLEVPSSTSVNVTSAFTAEAWVRLNSPTGSYQSIMERFGSPDASGDNGGFILRVMPTGKIQFFVLKSYQAGYHVTGGTLVTSGVWHHVAAVSDGTSMRVYLDGVLDGTLNVSYYPATGTSSLFIGRGNGEHGYLNGLIDEARLTASSLYSADFTPQSNLTSGPQTRGLWKFDGQSLTDFSGNGNAPAPRGNPAYSSNAAALAAHSVSFDGATGRAQVPHSATLDVAGPFTAEAWFKINNTGTNQYLVSCLTGTGGFVLMANQGMPQLYVTNSSGQSDFAIAYPPVITFDEWHHMAGVFDGSQLRVYLDGVLVASKATTIGPGSFAGSQFAIGSYQTGGGWLSGLVDEARVSAGALYTSNFTPKKRLTATSSTRGLWKFDGETLQDASGNNNNGTLTGGSTFSSIVP